MKKGWKIVLIIVAVALVLAAVCFGVGMITGANFDRITDGLEQFFAESYNIDFDSLVNEWIPGVWEAQVPMN